MVQTGLAGALGADIFARSNARRVAIIGAGTQGRTQLNGLRMVRDIAVVRVFDRIPTVARAFAADYAAAGLDCKASDSVDAAVEDADIIVASTWARTPFLFARHIRPGMHISSFGPDQPGKCEVAAEVLLGARTVVDDRNLAVEMGVIGGAGLDASTIVGELGEVIDGLVPGRQNTEDVTVFGSVGLAFQDLAAAWLAYQKAVAASVGQVWKALN
ncbi:hypothetical protein P7L69_08240 [Tistrella mobilis]